MALTVRVRTPLTSASGSPGSASSRSPAKSAAVSLSNGPMPPGAHAGLLLPPRRAILPASTIGRGRLHHERGRDPVPSATGECRQSGCRDNRTAAVKPTRAVRTREQLIHPRRAAVTSGEQSRSVLTSKAASAAEPGRGLRPGQHGRITGPNAGKDVFRRHARSVNVPPRLPSLGRMDTQASRAQQLARALLQESLPRRWAHVQGVADRARGLAPVLGADTDLPGAAAWLHDIGCSLPASRKS